MTQTEALRLALEALEGVLDDSTKVLDASISGGLYEVVQCRDAITAIKAALEAPQRTWVGLTDEEQQQAYEQWQNDGWGVFYNAIEAKLKEKNT